MLFPNSRMLSIGSLNKFTMKKRFRMDYRMLIGCLVVNWLLVYPSWGLTQKANKKPKKPVYMNQQAKEAKKPAKSGIIRQMGKISWSDQTLPNIDLQGHIKLENVTVEGDSEIQGFMKIYSSQLNTLETCGNVFVKDSLIKGLVVAYGNFELVNTTLERSIEVSGYLKAFNTTFLDTLQITSEKVSLESVTAQDIYINKIEYKQLFNLLGSKKPKVQTLTLTGDTIIKGSVTFESGNGIIILKDEAKIAGEVVGATIKK